MNSLLIVFSSAIIFFAGYRFYACRLEKIWEIQPARQTPAFTKFDGLDYVPAKHWTILFGHHFASIAGAGPILGPVIAALFFGWLPALIWIIAGCIFIGGVHDFSALMVSLRHEGASIAEVASRVLNFKTKLFFAAFIFLSLILVMAVFAVVTARTLINNPELVIPTFGLILAALLVSLMIYRLRLNQLIATLLGIVILVGLFVLGSFIPVSLEASPLTLWLIILFAYAFFASVLPVNVLLQPRDYLSTFILFFGMFFGYLGLIISRPQMQAPAFVAWKTGQGHLWPMLCVIIACGAISGFHSLIASGTSSKQIASEKDARKIGYGAMILEGFLAVLALLCVTAGLYWSNQGQPAGLVYPELMQSGDVIGTFSAGFGQLTRPILGLFGTTLAAVMLNAFVLTTLDSATRINRYITEELLGNGLNLKFFRNRYFSTAIIIVLAFSLALGNWEAIWPVFGASNQLVAALVFLVIFAYMVKAKKRAMHILLPALFMLATTLAALVWQGTHFLRQENFLLAFISGALFVLAIFMVSEVNGCRKRFLSKNTAAAQ